MFELAKDQMADGAATLAIILTSAWKAAGNPVAAQSVKVAVPAWLAPDYTNLRVKRTQQVQKSLSFFSVQNYAPQLESDCE